MSNQAFYMKFWENNGDKDYYLKYWLGKGGTEYLNNESEYKYWINDKRGELWQDIFSHMPDLTSVLEVGCGTGRNLKTIEKHFPALEIKGIEPNPLGCYIAQNLYTDVQIGKIQEIPEGTDRFDLVFTYGVLIHIGPHLKKAFEEMYRVSSRYILIIEYIHPVWESFANDFIRKGPFDQALTVTCPVKEIYRRSWTEWINENIDDTVEVRLYEKVNYEDDRRHMEGELR